MKKSKTHRPWAVALGAIVVGAVAYACATPLVPEDVKLRPTTLTAGSPTTRSATVGTTLQNEPAVIVRDQDGEPLPGQTVNFTVSSGTAPNPASTQTDDNGRAAPTSWALPTTSGSVTLTATVANTTLPAQVFTVTLTPGPATAAAVNSTTPSSNNQSAVAGSPVAVVPQVKVTDQYGNAVPGVPVTFAVTAGGGVVAPTTAVNTDPSGVARVNSWTLGSALGTNTLRATVSGIATPVIFTATGTAGTPASIVVGGDGSSQGQTAIANTSVANAPIVLVRDANNNPVPNVNVRFTIGGGAGKILTSGTDNTGQATIDVTTGAAGTASIFAWRLGTVGANTLNVSLPDHASVTTFVFTATATVGPPTQIAVSNQAWGFTQTGTAHGGSPSVVLRDAGGNLVAGRTVTWTSPNANSTVTAGASSTTNAQGVAAFPKATASWTAGTPIGQTMTLVATVSGVTPALTFSFTSKIVGTPTGLVKVSADSVTGAVSTALANKTAVRVVDANGDPVPGSSVSFAVTAGGGSVSPASALADSVGVSAATWTLGPTIGTNNNTLRASLTGSTTIFRDFTASAIAGAPATIQARTGNPTSGPVNSSITVFVVVRDAGGNLVSNASVAFAVTGTPTNAAITSTTPTTTNASGEASATWRLDTLARTNTVSATAGTVSTTLTATSTALGATKLVISSGNNQTAAPSTTLPVAPTVKVTDQYNNAVGGVSVTFAPAAGLVNCSGTFVASCTSTSTSTGFAAAQWQLGSAAGSQTLNSFLTSTPAVTVSFTATASAGCTVQSHTLGTTVNGTLAAGDCGSTDSPVNYYDNFRFTAGSVTFARFTVRPTGFTGRQTVWFWPAAGSGIAFAGAASGDSVTTYSIVAAGTYDVWAGSQIAGATGSYAFVSEVNPPVPVTWCGFQITKGASHAHTLSAGNCAYASTNNLPSTNRSSRAYFIMIAAGQSMQITMSGSLDNYIEVYDLTGTRTFVSSADAGFAGATETLTVSNTSGATKYYEIRATHFLTGTSDTQKTGTYTLSIAP